MWDFDSYCASALSLHTLNFLYFSGIRLPPPAYCEALKYPSNENGNIQSKPSSPWEQPIVKEHIYQTLPGESGEPVYVHHPGSYYNTCSRKKKAYYSYSYKTSPSGRRVIFLESIPETLASYAEMGVKTYSQLEVVAACSGKEDHVNDRCNDISCMEALVNGEAVLLSKGDNGSHEGTVENGVTALGSIEEHENEDDFDIRASLSSLCSNLDLNNSDLENASQLEIDIISLSKALAEKDEACKKSGNSEISGSTSNVEPRLNGEVKINLENEVDTSNAQLLKVSSQNSTDIDGDRTPTGDTNHGDSGYSECSSSKLEFNEHVSEHFPEPVIYSEPEYSSSDVSIKVGGDTPKHDKSPCQRTLKRTYNGVDHNVYELSPSDSFYSSVGENLHGECDNPSLNSSEGGIHRLSHSSGSLADNQRKPRTLLQDTQRKKSFKEPLLRGEPSHSGSLGRDSDTEQKTIAVGAESVPLVAQTLQNEDGCDTLTEQMVRIFRAETYNYRSHRLPL